MYVDLLYEHSSRSGVSLQLQAWLLSWVTHAYRPLRVMELAALIDSRSDRSGLDSSQDAKLIVRTSCGPLPESLDNETVQVIHHSFTEFRLDSSRNTALSPREPKKWFPALLPPLPHRSLTLSRMDYLLSGCFKSCSVYKRPTMPDDRGSEHKQLMVQFPFL
jgi:hypothetical protein